MSVPCRIGRIEICHRRRARKARIDDDQLGAAVGLRFGDPFEAARMGFGGVAAHDDDEIGVLDVRPGVRHRAATERRGQTGHRGSVSDARLVVECQDAGAAHDFIGQITRFRSWWRRRRGSRWSVQRLTVSAVLVLRDEVLVAVVLHAAGRCGQRVVPGDALELVRCPACGASGIAGGSSRARSLSALRPWGTACRDWSDGPHRPRCG